MKLLFQACAALLLLVLLLAPLPVPGAARLHPALVNEIQDAGHAPAFALMTLALFALLRRRFPAPAAQPWLICAIIMPALGVLTEWLQSITGRDASWTDLRSDVLGTSFALLVVAMREQRTRPGASMWRALMPSAALLLAVLAFVPLAWTVAAYLARAQASPVIWSEDSRMLKRFSHEYTGRWSGLAIDEVLPDWRGFGTLVVTVRNLANTPQDVAVRVHDLTHDNSYEDRFQRSTRLEPEERRRLRFSLDEIREAPQGRAMDLQRMRSIIIFQDTGGAPAPFKVIEVRLDMSPNGD